ncbi:MAG TPA: nitroreductase family deazaflavin-dependent oxidoreductase [Solirubrobacteraceae bacterium]|nr:nitroreductase family deazaflavin-dependent oxidoreductase [Solirubrobacteraceae bacterium]
MSGGDPEDRNWALLRRLIAVHTLLYRATRGRVGHHVRGTPPMLLLEHVGARSGVRRRAPLGYLADELGLVIVASKGGHRHNPSWFHNLRAHPDTVVQIGSKRQPVHARIADSDERRRLWPKVVELHAGYDDYQRHTEREIPLVILEPR